MSSFVTSFNNFSQISQKSIGCVPVVNNIYPNMAEAVLNTFKFKKVPNFVQT